MIDNYCYLINKCGPRPSLEPWLEAWTNTYDLLAGIPLPDTPPPADGFRAEDRSFQERIDRLLREVLSRPPFERFGARVLWLSNDRDRWAEQVFTTIAPLAQRIERPSYPQQFLNF